MTDCARKCWIFAALMGLVVWLMAMGHGGAGVFGGLFLAFVTAWLLGGLLVLLPVIIGMATKKIMITPWAVKIWS